MKPSTAISHKQIYITASPARPELHRRAERAEGLNYTAGPPIEYHIPEKIQAFCLLLEGLSYRKVKRLEEMADDGINRLALPPVSGIVI